MPVESIARTSQPDGSYVYYVDGEPVDELTYLMANQELGDRDLERRIRRLGEEWARCKANHAELARYVAGRHP